MIRFLDGPAEGEVLHLTRAPLFLRVCHGDDGTWDACDQLDDKPRANETITVYRMEGNRGSMHLHGRDKNGKRWGRREAIADYRLYASQPEEATLRDTAAWRAWAEAESKKEATTL